MPSDSELTAEEQAALDADKAAETTQTEEDAGAGAATQTPPVADDAGTADGTVDGGADLQATQRQGTVPHAALHEERTRRQETERQLAEERKARQTLEERTNLILQRFAAPQQPAAPATQAAPEIPSFEADPAGHILGQVRQQCAILGELVQAVTGQSRQNEAAAGMQQLTTRAAAMEREFATANPDYDKASSHLFEMRRQELVAAGWTDPAEIQTMMANEARGLAARALQQGRNPAAVVYELAKLRGYAAAPDPAANGGGNGAADPTAQLRTIERGQQQSRSVGNLRGAGPAPLTAQGLAEMSEADFLKAFGTPEGKALMGS